MDATTTPPAGLKPGRKPIGPHVQTRLPADALDRLKTRAIEQGTTVSALCRNYVLAGLEGEFVHRYMIQAPRHVASSIADFIRATVSGNGRRVERDGSIVTFDAGTYTYLAGLPRDSDGHIDDTGTLWIDGCDYEIGRL